MNPSDRQRGWHAFAHSPLGVVTTFVALLAVLTVTLAPNPTPVFGMAQVVFSMISLACVAVLSFRDHEPLLAHA